MTLQRKKEAAIAVAVNLYSILFMLGVALRLQSSDPWSAVLAVLAVIGALLWVSLIVIAFALTEHIGARVALLAVSPLAVILAGRLTVSSVLGAALLALLMVWARQRVVTQAFRYVTYKARYVFVDGVKIMMVGLLVGLASISVPALERMVTAERLAIPEEAFKIILKPAEPVFRELFPAYDSDRTIDEIIRTQLDGELARQPGRAAVDPAQEEVLRQQLAQQLGQPLSGQERLSTIIADMFNAQIERIAERDPRVVMFGLLVLALLALRLLIPFLVWPVLLIIIVLLALARQVGLVSVVRSQATIERLAL